MPICSCCDIEKSIECFSFRNKKEGIRQHKCKTCVAEVSKRHYESNKQDYKKRSKANRSKEYQKSRELLRKLKPKCLICDENWPEALDFHHINPNEKEVLVSCNSSSRKKLVKEASKCIVLCANHHRKYHSGHGETVEKVDTLVAQLVEAVDSKSSPVSVRL